MAPVGSVFMLIFLPTQGAGLSEQGEQYLSAVSREQRVANRFECRLLANVLASFVVVRFCQPLVVLSNML